jgi:hypothetical protein
MHRTLLLARFNSEHINSNRVLSIRYDGVFLAVAPQRFVVYTQFEVQRLERGFCTSEHQICYVERT